jgi:hypothetical protein
MNYASALKIADEHEHPSGFLVHFERVEGCLLASDYAPDPHAGDKPFDTEEEAWAFAERLSSATRGRFVNFYVVNARTFVPVPNYAARGIVNR